MYKNGVSHDICGQDFDGICTLLKWLSYVPKVWPGVVSGLLVQASLVRVP